MSFLQHGRLFTVEVDEAWAFKNNPGNERPIGISDIFPPETLVVAGTDLDGDWHEFYILPVERIQRWPKPEAKKGVDRAHAPRKVSRARPQSPA